MIRADVLNLQAQLLHLFRVFEVDVDVVIENDPNGSYGVVLVNAEGSLTINDDEAEEATL